MNSAIFKLFSSGALLGGLLTGCGGDIAPETDQSTVAGDVPFAYVQRSLPADGSSAATLAYQPGARLLVRERVSSDAADKEILAATLGSTEYDVKDLNVSPDGSRLIFSARTETSSWNLYEYSFSNGTVHRVMTDDDVAEAGHDTNPAYSSSGDILFASTRRSGTVTDAVSALFKVTPDGKDLKPLTSAAADDAHPVPLAGGGLVFIRTTGTDQGKVFSLVHLNEETGEEDVLASKEVTGSAAGLKLLKVIQDSNGHIEALIAHDQQSLQGGDIVLLTEDSNITVQSTATDTASTLNTESYTGGNVSIYPDKVSSAGWYSAFWPYRDSSKRMLISWTQCLADNSSLTVPCNTGTSMDDVNAHYGVWTYNPGSNTRQPVINGKAGIIYSDIAVAYPYSMARLNLTSEDNNPVDPTIPEDGDDGSCTGDDCGGDNGSDDGDNSCTGDDCDSDNGSDDGDNSCTGDDCDSDNGSDDGDNSCTGDDCDSDDGSDDGDNSCTGDDCDSDDGSDDGDNSCTGDDCDSDNGSDDTDTESPVAGHCYSGQGYWKTHHRYASNPALQVAWPEVMSGAISEDMPMCTTSWLENLNAEPLGNAFVILSHQWIAARLNQANGAEMPATISNALSRGEELLAQCQISYALRTEATALAALLDDFNDDEDCSYSEPEKPIASRYGVVNIRSIYEYNGADMMADQGGITALRDPSLNPLDERSERFIRVMARESGTPSLLGYAEIHPDGSALFQVPADTAFSLEVVNARLKAIASKDTDHEYLAALSEQTLSVGAGEMLEYQQGSTVNPGAAAAGAAFSNTDSSIVASAAGQTMAEVMADYLDTVPAVTTDVHYTDQWSAGSFTPAADIDYSYSNLTTPAPASAACLNDWDETCSAQSAYLRHIQPIWEQAGRDSDGRSCVACHDNSGATGIDLTWDGVAATSAGVVSYRQLFSVRETYMYLANRFSTVAASHCARQAEFPFAAEPGNDCFTCYSRILMSDQGALESANFYEIFGTDPDHDLYRYDPDGESPRVDHGNMLSAEELRVISEWLDNGAPL